MIVLNITSLQCYSVLSDIWVKIKLCIPLESESSVLSTCNAFVCLLLSELIRKIGPHYENMPMLYTANFHGCNKDNFQRH